jgi:site-specific DNA-cytosine methylase
MSRIVRVVDLACGAGLGARGLIDELNHLGFTARVVFACDTWGPAIESYERNVTEAKGGVHQVPVDEAVRRGLIPPSDLLIAGPPCIRDSTLTACRSDVADRSLEMADIKEGVLGVARQTARRFAIETNRGWDAWGVRHGLLPVRVSDTELGGYTLRRRTFLLSHIQPAPTKVELRRGWGEALPQHARCLLSSDVHAAAKRAKYARPPDKPAHAVVGHGGAPLVYCDGQQVHRCTPGEALRLQGFLPQIFALRADGVRDRQTLVGNGWPRSYGQWLARSYALTEGRSFV